MLRSRQMSKNLNYLKVAIKLSRKTENDMHFHHGAILVKGKNIVSLGFNSTKTHRLSNEKFKNLHAEIHCILGIPFFKLYGSTLYIARTGYENRKEIMLSKPCENCQAAIYSSGIRKVFYSIDSYHVGFWNVWKNETKIIILPNSINEYENK